MREGKEGMGKARGGVARPVPAAALSRKLWQAAFGTFGRRCMGGVIRACRYPVTVQEIEGRARSRSVAIISCGRKKAEHNGPGRSCTEGTKKGRAGVECGRGTNFYPLCCELERARTPLGATSPVRKRQDRAIAA